MKGCIFFKLQSTYFRGAFPSGSGTGRGNLLIAPAAQSRNCVPLNSPRALAVRSQVYITRFNHFYFLLKGQTLRYIAGVAVFCLCTLSVGAPM